MLRTRPLKIDRITKKTTMGIWINNKKKKRTMRKLLDLIYLRDMKVKTRSLNDRVKDQMLIHL